MLEQEKKAVCWKNGEFEEYLVTTGFSWETLESVTAKTDRNTVAEIGRLYRLGILPKHPFLARQVILGSLSGDEEIPYPKETPEGTILDRRMVRQFPKTEEVAIRMRTMDRVFTQLSSVFQTPFHVRPL